MQKIDIKYAKSAKRVDVKRLKSTIWNILTSKEKPVSIFIQRALYEYQPVGPSVVRENYIGYVACSTKGEFYGVPVYDFCVFL